ncbi:hypothetical protein ASPSYDRAFT_768792 [Aspergillus sydowii CBS 593.65]|uniref:Uncharacterized protein n=1 Tax=Aspergillus sydowii CBS 593.65 TaxID=1036612 RepID=A0A1L9TN29_9EURO|nr:uncharacterized protein ASPSYDRAFT_768792 [Aspergillus sydowii CBS 593.65]OJJ60811.1 hypothetical protein ASPSYDRAFT_768792 [Aspergillus sydowii CBS 593.65]
MLADHSPYKLCPTTGYAMSNKSPGRYAAEEGLLSSATVHSNLLHGHGISLELLFWVRNPASNYLYINFGVPAHWRQSNEELYHIRGRSLSSFSSVFSAEPARRHPHPCQSASRLEFGGWYVFRTPAEFRYLPCRSHTSRLRVLDFTNRNSKHAKASAPVVFEMLHS